MFWRRILGWVGGGALCFAAQGGEITDCNQNGIDDSLDLQGAPNFAVAREYLTAPLAAADAVGDINGDGLLDFVAIAVNEETVNVVLNLGDGSFAFPMAFPVGAGPRGVAVGAINHDDFDDVVVTNRNSNDVTIYFGSASGELSGSGTVTGTLSQPVRPILGYFSNDTLLDLVIVEQSGLARSYLGNGAGGFSAVNTVMLAGSPTGGIAVDLDGDSRDDLAFCFGNPLNQYELVFTAAGGGFFGVLQTLGAGDLRGIAAADLDNDTDMDLIVARRDTAQVVVRMNDGAGSFPLVGVPYASGANPAGIATGDFDDDGRPDVVVINRDDKDVRLLRNVGGGVLSAVSDRPVARFSQSAYVFDVNADGDHDIVTSSISGVMTVLDNDGAANFPGGPGFFITEASVFRLVVADFSSDGVEDIGAVLSSGGLRVYRRDGNIFTLVHSQPTGPEAIGLIAAQLNADVHVDLIVTESDLGQMSIFFGNGDGTFSAPSVIAVPARVAHVVAGDLDDDGDQDVVVASGGPYTNSCNCFMGIGEVRVFRNDGAGNLSVAQTMMMGGGPFAVALGRFDGDQLPDLAVGLFSAGEIKVHLNAGNAQFSATPSATIPHDNDVWDVVAADFNGDGLDDLASTRFQIVTFVDDTIAVALGHGDGTFSTADYYPAAGAIDLLAADLDADGDLDLVAGEIPIEDVTVLDNRGDGVFTGVNSYLFGESAPSVGVMNWNGDERPDLVAAALTPSRIMIVTNTAQPPFSADVDNNGVPDECQGLVGDLNCDGAITLSDIAPFVLALTNPAAYAASFPACDINLADVSQDGMISVSDIAPFVALLTGG